MRNGAPFSKPRVRLFGEPGDAQAYLGAAYNLLHKVRQYCETTGAPVFAMQRTLENGAVVQAAVFGNEESVSCYPPAFVTSVEQEPKREEIKPKRKQTYIVFPKDADNLSGWPVDERAEALVNVAATGISAQLNTLLLAGGSDWTSESGRTVFTYRPADFPRHTVASITPPPFFWYNGEQVEVRVSGVALRILASAIYSREGVAQLVVAGYTLGMTSRQIGFYTAPFSKESRLYSAQQFHLLTLPVGVDRPMHGSFSESGERFATFITQGDDATIYEVLIQDRETAPFLTGSLTPTTLTGFGHISVEIFYDQHLVAPATRSHTLTAFQPGFWDEPYDVRFDTQFGESRGSEVLGVRLSGKRLLCVDYTGETLQKFVAQPRAGASEWSTTVQLVSDNRPYNIEVNYTNGGWTGTSLVVLGQDFIDRVSLEIPSMAPFLAPHTATRSNSAAIDYVLDDTVVFSTSVSGGVRDRTGLYIWDNFQPNIPVAPEDEDDTPTVLQSAAIVHADPRHGVFAVVHSKQTWADPSNPAKLVREDSVRVYEKSKLAYERALGEKTTSIIGTLQFSHYGYFERRYTDVLPHAPAPYDYIVSRPVAFLNGEFPFPFEMSSSFSAGGPYTGLAYGVPRAIPRDAHFVRFGAQSNFMAAKSSTSWLACFLVNHLEDGRRFIGIGSDEGVLFDPDTLFDLGQDEDTFRLFPVRVV